MSRMVRDSQTSGLRERHWFARVMLGELEQGVTSGRGRGELLALRGAVIFHLYSALVGLARAAAGNHGLADRVDALLGLAAIAEALTDVHAPEWQILSSALDDPADPIHWLQAEVYAACGASGLARRPESPRDENPLALSLEDPNQPLAEGDLKRLHAAVSRVQTVLEDATSQMQEW